MTFRGKSKLVLISANQIETLSYELSKWRPQLSTSAYSTLTDFFGSPCLIISHTFSNGGEYLSNKGEK